MKNFIITTALLCSITAMAQQPQLTPQQQIDLERKAQVEAQGEGQAVPPVVKVRRPTNAKRTSTTTTPVRPGTPTDAVNNATTGNRTLPAQHNTTNIGGVGTSGTAGNTIGAPNTAVKVTGTTNGTQVPVPTNTNPTTTPPTGVPVTPSTGTTTEPQR